METEKRLLSLINSVRVLNLTRDLSDVLHQLIKEVLRVIEGSNASVLFLYDKKSDELYAKSAIGFDMSYLKDIRMKPGQGMSGKTYSSKEGQVFTSSDDTFEGMADLTSQTKELYAQSLGRMEYPMSAICVPLISNEECIGVLTVDIYEKEMQFDQTDLQLLETFATQATIAIENATLFSQNERTQRIHKELSRVFLSKRGLEDITKTLASLIDKDIIVFNEWIEPLALSNEETTSYSTELRNLFSQTLNEVIIKGEVVFHEVTLQDHYYTVYFFPIKTEKLTLGLLTVVVDEQVELDPLDRFAVEQALTIFAMEIDRQEKLVAEDFSYSGTLLEQLLHEPYDELSPNHPVKLNFPERADHQYVIVKLFIENPLLSFEKLNEKKAHLTRLVYRELAKLPYKTLVHDKNMELTFMFTVRSGQNEDLIFEGLYQLFSKIIQISHEQFGLDHFAGMGKMVEKLTNINYSNQGAGRCIQYLQTTAGKQSIMSYSQLGPNRLFLKSDRNELQEYVDETIGEIITYDRKHGSELLRTLEVYFESNQNMVDSAKSLYVHVNTIKYRLRTIRQLLNITTIKGENAFELQLALRAANYLSM
ncbi:helix-turn-helix domain-containing protein [Halobacillus andaensis]|uniref:helix-turn-helix domain-containing protein n=1 Tax=Halobacillus andaensis TaxID=1176239 RepID=UPI003D72B780